MKKFVCFFFVFSVMISLFAMESSAAVKTIDSTMYNINSDGTLGEKYTGWTTRKASGDRYYFENGAKQTGWQTIKNKLYYFSYDGIMRTGRVHVDSLPDSPYESNVIIDKNGVWDGKTFGRYQPETLSVFLLDYNLDLLDTVKIGNTAMVYKQIDAVDYLVKVLKNNSDAKIFTGYSSNDEIEVPDEWNNIVKSEKICFFKENAGKSWWVVFNIGKDTKGNTWLYEVNGNWVVNLAKNPEAYDVITKL